jgi:hypothetical protein
MGFVSSITESVMEGVVIPAIVVPDVIGKVVLRCLLKGDLSPCTSRSMESVLWVIATPAWATALVAAVSAPPNPSGVSV